VRRTAERKARSPRCGNALRHVPCRCNLGKSPFFCSILISHAVNEARGRWHGINSGAVVSRPAGTVGFEGHATSRESQLAPSTCVRRTSAQAVRCSHQPRAGCGAAAEVGAAIRSLRDSRSEEPSDSESASCFWAGKRESSRPGPLGKFRRS
jgi:hypothetical protein